MYFPCMTSHFMKPAAQNTSNVIHWATKKFVETKMESWGDRDFYTVEVTTDIADDKEFLKRFNAGLSKKYPHGRNSMPNTTTALVDGKRTVTYNFYSSIGD